MNSSKYLQQTEKAVKQLFTALQFYRNQIRDSQELVFVSSKNNEAEGKEKYENWFEENKKKLRLREINKKSILDLQFQTQQFVVQ